MRRCSTTNLNCKNVNNVVQYTVYPYARYKLVQLPETQGFTFYLKSQVLPTVLLSASSMRGGDVLNYGRDV